MKMLLAMAMAVLLAGCAVPREVLTGSTQCRYIGCETGGLIVYPHQ